MCPFFSSIVHLIAVPVLRTCPTVVHLCQQFNRCTINSATTPSWRYISTCAPRRATESLLSAHPTRPIPSRIYSRRTGNWPASLCSSQRLYYVIVSHWPLQRGHESDLPSRWGTGTGKRARTVTVSKWTGLSHVRETNLAARGKVLALGQNTLLVVDVVLPAVLGLVRVGEAGVDT